MYRRAAAKDDQLALERLKQLGVPRHDPKEIQRMLARLGYAPGTIDGKIGSKGKRAIRAFQRARGLRINGRTL